MWPDEQSTNRQLLEQTDLNWPPAEPIFPGCYKLSPSNGTAQRLGTTQPCGHASVYRDLDCLAIEIQARTSRPAHLRHVDSRYSSCICTIPHQNPNSPPDTSFGCRDVGVTGCGRHMDTPLFCFFFV